MTLKECWKYLEKEVKAAENKSPKRQAKMARKRAAKKADASPVKLSIANRGRVKPK